MQLNAAARALEFQGQGARAEFPARCARQDVQGSVCI